MADKSPNYLFIGSTNLEPLDGCSRCNLQLCDDCGFVLTKIDEWVAECGCCSYVKNVNSGHWLRSDK